MRALWFCIPALAAACSPKNQVEDGQYELTMRYDQSEEDCSKNSGQFENFLSDQFPVQEDSTESKVPPGYEPYTRLVVALEIRTIDGKPHWLAEGKFLPGVWNSEADVWEFQDTEYYEQESGAADGDDYAHSYLFSSGTVTTYSVDFETGEVSATLLTTDQSLEEESDEWTVVNVETTQLSQGYLLENGGQNGPASDDCEGDTCTIDLFSECTQVVPMSIERLSP